MTDVTSNQKVPSSAALARHMIFICPECGVKSDTHEEWRKHLNALHGYNNKTPEQLDFIEIDNKCYECQICKHRLAYAHQTPVLLQYHRFSHMRYSPYKCRYCPSSYAKKRTLSVHIFRFHRRLINSLDRQRLDPKYNKEFYIHYVCPQCGKVFELSQEWERHINEAHLSTSSKIGMHRIAGTADYYCDQCSHTVKNNPTRNELRRHHFSHLPKPDFFQCAFCPMRMSQKIKLYGHLLISHKDKYSGREKFLKRPQEWGDTSHREKTKANFPRKIDILQKALLNSSIDLKEMEDSANEIKRQQSNIKNSIEDDEFEQIFPLVFEEITEDQCWNENMNNLQMEKSQQSLEFSEKLRKEMQKYINYLCPICQEEFNTQPAWRSHVFDEHNLENNVKSKFRPLNENKTSFLCLLCNQIQRTTKHSDLQRHHFQHMPYQDYLKCTICMESNKSKPKMFHHMKFIHRIQIANDDTDDEIYNPSKVSFSSSFNCLECDEVFDNRILLKSHYKTCPSRLSPIGVGQYDIGKNNLLLKHLHKASQRIDYMLKAYNINADKFKINS